MSIDWDGYEVYHPGVTAPLQTVPRVEAQRAYQRCMETKAARIEMLRRLLGTSGVELRDDDASVQRLNDWFFDNVEPDPNHPGWLLPEWYSVVHDVGVYVGDVIIGRHANLHWEFFTWGKRNVSYQRPVIMGFSTEDPKFHTNIDLERLVAAYGHGIVEQRGSVSSYDTVTVRGVEIDVDAIAAHHRHRKIETDKFRRWLHTAARRA
jgi:hypothetical protein